MANFSRDDELVSDWLVGWMIGWFLPATLSDMDCNKEGLARASGRGSALASGRAVPQMKYWHWVIAKAQVYSEVPEA